MRKDKSWEIINYFLLILVLIALGVILYLLYQYWRAQNMNDYLKAPTEIVTQNNGDNPTTTTGQKLAEVSRIASFSYEYPVGWTVEENTDASFATIRNDKNENLITIRVLKKAGSLNDLPFDQYAAQAAKTEIQGYDSLSDIKQMKTVSGLTAYKTTWNVKFLGGEQFISNPITYFEHPLDKSKSIQITLENPNYEKQYDELVTSFEIKQ